MGAEGGKEKRKKVEWRGEKKCRAPHEKVRKLIKTAFRG